jgi:hypothetical protein
MAKGEEIPETNPAEIKKLIEQMRATNLEPGAKEKIERLLRTVLALLELLQRKNTSLKKLRQMIFGKRTERHQAKKAEALEKVDESEKSDDDRPKASGDQEAHATAHLHCFDEGESATRTGKGCGLPAGARYNHYEVSG